MSTCDNFKWLWIFSMILNTFYEYCYFNWDKQLKENVLHESKRTLLLACFSPSSPPPKKNNYKFNDCVILFSLSINFRLEIIEQSAKKVLFFGLLSRENSGGRVGREGTWPNMIRDRLRLTEEIYQTFDNSLIFHFE